MKQVVYGLNKDNGDGSSRVLFFRDRALVDRLLDVDQYEEFYSNEGSPAITLTFPADLDLVACGFRFSDSYYT